MLNHCSCLLVRCACVRRFFLLQRGGGFGGVGGDDGGGVVDLTQAEHVFSTNKAHTHTHIHTHQCRSFGSHTKKKNTFAISQ